MKLKKAPLFLVFLLTLSSCIKHVDFDQIEDFSATPIIESSLVHYSLTQADFFDLVNSVEIVTPITDTSGFTVFDNKFVQENLVKTRLNFEISNEFNREFTVNIVFLDDNDKETYVFKPIIVQKNKLDGKYSEEIAISGNTLFLSTTKMSVSITLSPSSDGSVIDPTTQQTIELKSSAIFHLKT